MKKVLLIGQLNQTLSGINKYLATQFQTQVCMDTLDLVKGMIKVFEPDFAVIYLAGINELDKRILTFFENQYSEMPILLIGTDKECKCYEKYYENPQIDFLVRPITCPVLIKKCMNLLHLTEQDMQVKAEENEIKKVQEPKKYQIDVEEPQQYILADNEERKKHILAVDDNGVLLRSVKAILEKKYSVAVATSGKMALKQAKKKLPDLIILDYEMPEWDGRKTLQEIRADKELKDIPVVFLTGVNDRNHITAVLGLNPAGYLLKPIEQKKFLESIESVLNK